MLFYFWARARLEHLTSSGFGDLQIVSISLSINRSILVFGINVIIIIIIIILLIIIYS